MQNKSFISLSILKSAVHFLSIGPWTLLSEKHCKAFFYSCLFSIYNHMAVFYFSFFVVQGKSYSFCFKCVFIHIDIKYNVMQIIKQLLLCK